MLLIYCYEDEIIFKILLSLNKVVEFFINKEIDLNLMYNFL